MGQGLLEAPHQGFPLTIFRRNVARPWIVVGHGGNHHHAIACAPDFHAFDALGMDVVHDLGPCPAGRVKLLIFRDFSGVIDQIQRKAKAAAHFVALPVMLWTIRAHSIFWELSWPRSCACIRPTMWWSRWAASSPATLSMM